MTTVAPGVTVLDSPPVPMSQPAIVPTFPGSISGPASLGVDQTPQVLLAGVPTPVSTPPMGCSKCGAPAIVATAVPAPVVQMAPQLPSSADLAALFDKLPWWVWLIVAVLALRGLFK